MIKLVSVLFFSLVISINGDVTELLERPKFSLKEYNHEILPLESDFEQEDRRLSGLKPFPQHYHLPQDTIRKPFRPISHLHTRPQNFESGIHQGYNYPKPSQPFPESSSFRPFEPTTSVPDIITANTDTEDIDNRLQVQELQNPAPWKPQGGIFLFEVPSPIASHHQSVIYYALPRTSIPLDSLKAATSTRGNYFVPKVFYLPPDFYHQETHKNQEHRL